MDDVKNYCFYNFVMMKNYRMNITICEKYLIFYDDAVNNLIINV